MKETVTEGSRFPVNHQDPEGDGGRKIVDTEEIDNKVEFHPKSTLRSCQVRRLTYNECIYI